jgi:hypothetical protein
MQPSDQKKPGIHHQQRMNTTDARNCPGTVIRTSSISGESKAQEIALIKKMLSAERFESYRKTEVESDDVIFARYQWNAEICEAFYAPLRILEVVLRNSFGHAISVKIKDPNWLTGVPQWLREIERNDILKAHRFSVARKRVITQGRVVQEMRFGFWIGLPSMPSWKSRSSRCEILPF